MKGYGQMTIRCPSVDPVTWEKIVTEFRAIIKDRDPELSINTEYHVTG